MLAALSLVVASGGFHAVWNLFAKRSGNPTAFLWLLQWFAAAIFLPSALWAWSHHPMTPTGWLFLLATAGLHGMYVILLSWTYSVGNLSQVYPLMRGISPLLVPVLGTWALGEHLTRFGWIGVGSVVLGIAALGDWRLTGPKPRRRALFLALTVGLFVTGYTTIDKLTLQYVPAVMLNDGSNIGNLLALTWPALHTRAVADELRRHWRTIVLGGLLSPGGYLLFLIALRSTPVARLAPMREIGIVLGTVLGITVLKEPQGWRRLGSAILIAFGVIGLGLWG